MKKLLFFVSLGFLLFFGVVNSVQYVHAYIDGEYNVNITTVINGAEDSITTLENQKYGSLITPFTSTDAPEGHEFSFWIVNGVVRKDLTSEHKFAVTANLEIAGIFEPLDGSAHAVIFIDSNGKLIQTSFVLNDQTVTPLPSIEGFSKPQYVVSTTPWKEANGNAAVFTNITESKVFVLQYELAGDVEPVTITVNGTPQEYAYNEVVTVTADLEGFTHWEENGVVVSYDESYTFTALTNRELLAKNDGSFPQPLVTLSNVSGIRAGYKSFLGQVYLPSGFEIVELGLIASSEEKVLLLDDVNATVIPSNTIQANTKEFLRSFHESSFTTFRAYAVLRNGENVVVEYSDNNYYSVPEVVGKKYTETFDDLSLSGTSYTSGEYTGIAGQVWNYTNARGDQTLDGKALTTQDGYLTTTFSNGLSRFKFDYKRAFTGTKSRSFEIYINDDYVDTITVPNDNDDINTYDSGSLNYVGLVNLKIKGIGTQKIIDNIEWDEQNQEPTDTKLYGVEFIDNDTSTLKSVREGKFVQEPVEPSKDGYTFIGWFKNESDSEPYNFNTPIYEHIILHAKYIPIPQYTVTFDLNGGTGSIENQLVYKNYFAILPDSNPTNGELKFKGWYDSAEGGQLFDFENTPIIEDTIIYAQWTADEVYYNVNFSVDGGEPLESQQIIMGNVATNPGNAVKAGYVFVGWYSSSDYITEFNFDVPILEHTTIYAKFASLLVLDSGTFAGKASLPNGWTHNGLGSDYADAGSKLKFDTTGDSLTTPTFTLLKNVLVSIVVKGNGTSGSSKLDIKDQNGNILHTITSFGTTNNTVTFTITDTSITQITLVYTKDLGNVGVGSVKIEHIPG